MKLDINVIAETLLWENVSKYVEQVTELRTIIGGITYIDVGLIDKIDECEILDTEEFTLIEITEGINSIRVKFEMPFALCCWANKKHIFSVTAVANGECVIPDEKNFDYSSVDFDSMNRKDLLDVGEIVCVDNIKYNYVEVDMHV